MPGGPCGAVREGAGQRGDGPGDGRPRAVPEVGRRVGIVRPTLRRRLTMRSVAGRVGPGRGGQPLPGPAGGLSGGGGPAVLPPAGGPRVRGPFGPAGPNAPGDHAGEDREERDGEADEQVHREPGTGPWPGRRLGSVGGRGRRGRCDGRGLVPRRGRHGGVGRGLGAVGGDPGIPHAATAGVTGPERVGVDGGDVGGHRGIRVDDAEPVEGRRRGRPVGRGLGGAQDPVDDVRRVELGMRGPHQSDDAGGDGRGHGRAARPGVQARGLGVRVTWPVEPRRAARVLGRRRPRERPHHRHPAQVLGVGPPLRVEEHRAGQAGEGVEPEVGVDAADPEDPPRARDAGDGVVAAAVAGACQDDGVPGLRVRDRLVVQVPRERDVDDLGAVVGAVGDRVLEGTDLAVQAHRHRDDACPGGDAEDALAVVRALALAGDERRHLGAVAVGGDRRQAVGSATPSGLVGAVDERRPAQVRVPGGDPAVDDAHRDPGALADALSACDAERRQPPLGGTGLGRRDLGVERRRGRRRRRRRDGRGRDQGGRDRPQDTPGQPGHGRARTVVRTNAAAASSSLTRYAA